MDDSTSKEKLLKKIRNALIYKLENPFQQVEFETDIYAENNEPLDIRFAQEFDKINGNFIYCIDENELISNFSLLAKQKNWENVYCIDESISNIIKKTGITIKSSEEEFLQQIIGVTACEYLVSRLGSIMISSASASGRRMMVYPEIHIVIAYTSQLVHDIKTALRKMKLKYQNKLPSLISVISGPSRTADIEKTLVMGAHGPKEIYLFLIDNGIEELL